MTSSSLIGIVGPTGVGKSEVALAIARLTPSEIIAVDSMQVYRGMDLGTGKPSPAARKEVPHHGLDLADPSESFSVAQYIAAVSPIIPQIIERKRLPVLVAGTGLYLKALLDGLCPAPPENPHVREQILAEGKKAGWETVHARLQQVDPAAAARIHPNDSRRITRALEVFSVSKKPISEWQESTSGILSDGMQVELFGLNCQRVLLYRRIEARIDSWCGAGWLEEAKKLAAQPLSKTAGEALGYKEMYAHLRGERKWEESVSLIKRNTRHYAKRQMTWFRRDSRVRWISTDGISAEQAARQILEQRVS